MAHIYIIVIDLAVWMCYLYVNVFYLVERLARVANSHEMWPNEAEEEEKITEVSTESYGSNVKFDLQSLDRLAAVHII